MPAIRTSDDCLQHMRSVSSVLAVLRRALSTTISLPPSATLPSLPNTQSPQASSIATNLEANYIRSPLATDLARTYERRVSDLWKYTESQIEGLLQRYQDNLLSSDIPENNTQLSLNSVSVAETIIMRRYHSMLRHWKEVAFETQTAHSTPQTSSFTRTGKSRPTFNHDCVPLLERYFDYNAYPSNADRSILAEKTGLTHRQIEVWFQNHRNRAKKTGKPRARLAGSSFPWGDVEDVLLDTKQSCEIPEPVETGLLSPPEPAHIVVQPPPGQVNILEKFDPPKNAFPAPFLTSRPKLAVPPTSLYNPNDWDRQPTRKRSSRGGTSIETLCDSFQTCLNLRKRCTTEGKSQEDPMQPWYPATYTHLYPSHHPAMLRRSRRRARTSSSPLYSFRKPVAHSPSPTLRKDGFLRYRHQPSTLTGSLAWNQIGIPPVLQYAMYHSEVIPTPSCSWASSRSKSDSAKSSNRRRSQYLSEHMIENLAKTQSENLWSITGVQKVVIRHVEVSELKDITFDDQQKNRALWL